MKNYILGYSDSSVEVTDDGENLTLYATAVEAAYQTEEWCVVEADSLSEARLKYETSFKNRQDKTNN